MANTNDLKSLKFYLTDGKSVEVVSYDFITEKLSQNLQPIISDIESINSHLTDIDNKLTEWVPVGGESNG